MSIKKLFLFTTTWIMLLTFGIFSQTFEWAICSSENTGMYSANNFGKVINSDALGNIYVVGTFNDTINFNGVEIKCLSQSTAFIAKFNSDGVCQWANAFGNTHAWATDNIEVDGAATDQDGNTYVVLGFLYEGEFDGTEYSAGTYLVKYDNSGNLNWVTGDTPPAATRLKLDSEENVIVCGPTKISKFSKNGDLISSFPLSMGYNAVYGFTVDSEDNIYLTGSCIISDSDLGGTTISLGNYFLVKFNSVGEQQWVKTSSGDGVEIGERISIDANGAITVAGNQTDSYVYPTDANYDGIEILNSKYFLIQYDKDGNIQWGNAFTAYCYNLISDWQGGIYMTGWYQNTGYFGTDSLTQDATSMGNAYVVKFNSSGEVVWMTQTYGYHYEKIWGLSFDNNNNLIATGQFYHTGIFGTDTLKQVGAFGAFPFIFVTKLSNDLTDVENLGTNTPSEFILSQNYPNPFNPSTNINFSLPENVDVKLSVLNILGQEVAILINEKKEAGSHTIVFHSNNLSSGVYLIKLQANNISKIIKMVLLR